MLFLADLCSSFVKKKPKKEQKRKLLDCCIPVRLRTSGVAGACEARNQTVEHLRDTDSDYVMKKPSHCWLGAVPRYWKVVSSCFQNVSFAENTSAPLAPRARIFQPILLLWRERNNQGYVLSHVRKNRVSLYVISWHSGRCYFDTDFPERQHKRHPMESRGEQLSALFFVAQKQRHLVESYPWITEWAKSTKGNTNFQKEFSSNNFEITTRGHIFTQLWVQSFSQR